MWKDHNSSGILGHIYELAAGKNSKDSVFFFNFYKYCTSLRIVAPTEYWPTSLSPPGKCHWTPKCLPSPRQAMTVALFPGKKNIIKTGNRHLFKHVGLAQTFSFTPGVYLWACGAQSRKGSLTQVIPRKERPGFQRSYFPMSMNNPLRAILFKSFFLFFFSFFN